MHLPVISFKYRFEEQEAPGSRSFFTEIIASISDIKFGKNGRYILSRDYMTLKVWIPILAFYLFSMEVEVLCLLDWSAIIWFCIESGSLSLP